MPRLIACLIFALLAAPISAATVVQGLGYCYWDDVQVPGLLTRPSGASAADEVAWKTTLFIYDFDASLNEEIFGSVQMPHRWNGTAVDPHVHWVPMVSSDGVPAAQKVVWCMDYTWAEVGTTFPALTTALCGSTSLPDEEPVADRHYLTELSAHITPGAGADAGSSVLYFRLYRNAASGTDTFEGNAGLISVDFHFQSCKAGSLTEVPD